MNEEERAELEGLRSRALELVQRLSSGGRDDASRDALLEDLADFQSQRLPAFTRLRRLRGHAAAVPTDVFRHVRLALHSASDDVREFHTSGTTADAAGKHAFFDLRLYDTAARAAAARMLFPDVAPDKRMHLVILAPSESEAPHSSLSYMLARFAEWFGERTSYVWSRGALDVDRLVNVLDEAVVRRAPLALLGTSFAFVHADELLADRRWSLPPGSRVMQTGGFKGRSRVLEPNEMLRAIATRYGVPEPWVICEYGMTELSSQMYETTLRDAVVGSDSGPRRLWVPGWMRARAVHPETLEPVPLGQIGVLRIDDVANVDSICMIQTSDLAREVDDGIEMLGRAPQASLRGCSLAIEEAMGTVRP